MTQTATPLITAQSLSAEPAGAQPLRFPGKGSTGPKTTHGKRIASLNALRFGLYADAVLVKGEDREDYLRFARAIVAGLDVQNVLEMACAERIVSALWRARRARRYEQAHLNKDRREQELAKHERDTEAARRLSNCERMTAKELKFAASALAGVFWREVREAELPDEFWDAFPDRGNIARKSVARIAEVVREIFKSVYVAEDSHAFWAWVGEKRGSAATWLQHERDEAGADYAKALRQTFLLDPTYGDAFSSELRAGRVLHDAERRLDRQVTQALADLEVARRLRS